MYAVRYSPHAFCVAGPNEPSTSSSYPQALRNSCSFPTAASLSPRTSVRFSAGYCGQPKPRMYRPLIYSVRQPHSCLLPLFPSKTVKVFPSQAVTMPVWFGAPVQSAAA
mgnify:CR=1 FL=1